MEDEQLVTFRKRNDRPTFKWYYTTTNAGISVHNCTSVYTQERSTCERRFATITECQTSQPHQKKHTFTSRGHVTTELFI